jgi:hypothetical protein
MTPRQDLLDHAVDLFPAPEGSVADVRRDVARRHRNRRLGAAAAVLAIWVVIGAAVSTLRTEDVVPIQPATPVPSPTVAPGTVASEGWPSDSDTNFAGLTYSWDGQQCRWSSCDGAWLQNGTDGGSGRISIHFDGVPGITRPHEGRSVTIFGYEGSYQAGIRGDIFLGVGNGSLGPGYKASCERWMVDIQGTTVAITLCVGAGAPAHEAVEAHEIIESIQIEPRDADPGFRLVFTLPTKHWSGNPPLDSV